MLTITCSENARKVENICQHLLQITLVAQTVKNLPAIREIVVQSLGQKDPLEKGMATHSSILAWIIPWTEGLEGYSPWDGKRVRHNLVTNVFTFILYI